MRFYFPSFTAFLTAMLVFSATARAASTHVAVAANFTDAAYEIAEAFANSTEHEAILSFGATGQLYAQIAQGAPFDILLAADDVRTARSIKEGYGVRDTDFTYAIGQLVLYSIETNKVNGAQTLSKGDFQRIAIANPDTAPYGVAAVQAMTALGVYESLQPKIVQGQNISQTYQYVQTGNAELGFVAFGQVMKSNEGSRWLVPQELYEPIRQNAVLLKQGQDNPAAKAFVDYLQGEEAAQIIQKYGYTRQ